MRFVYMESMCDPSYYPALARAAEQAGYDSFGVPDSICYPEKSDSTYPYTPDGSREFLEDKPFLDPFCLIAALGAVTERLRFLTFVVKLAVRNPILAAKQATSVAVLSNNRLRFGVGLSPWPDDFQICQQPWEKRGKRMDEMMQILRLAEKGEYFHFEGEFYNVPSLKLTPAPSKPIPLLVGGHSDAAIRRAVRYGDGWVHAGGDPQELENMLATVTRMRREYGREQDDFEILVGSLDGFSVDGVRRLEERGISDVLIGFRDSYLVEKDTQPLQEKIDLLSRFGDDVIAKL